MTKKMLLSLFAFQVNEQIDKLLELYRIIYGHRI